MDNIENLKNLFIKHIPCIGGNPSYVRTSKTSVFLDEFSLEVCFTKIKNNNVAAILLTYKSLLKNKRELIKYLPQDDFYQIVRFVTLCAAEQMLAKSFEKEIADEKSLQ